MTIKIGSYDKGAWLTVRPKSVKCERSFQLEQQPVSESDPIITMLGLKEQKVEIEFSISTDDLDTFRSVMGETVWLKQSSYDIITLDNDVDGDLFSVFDERVSQDPGNVSKTKVRLTLVRNKRGL